MHSAGGENSRQSFTGLSGAVIKVMYYPENGKEGKSWKRRPHLDCVQGERGRLVTRSPRGRGSMGLGKKRQNDLLRKRRKSLDSRVAGGWFDIGGS